MTTINYSDWVGRSETCADNLDPDHVRRIALALGRPAPGEGEALPQLWKWAVLVRSRPYEELGRDGHPGQGGFLPPLGERNRMWAGGRVRFQDPLRVGIPAERRSTILNVQEKTGRSGSL